MLSTKACLYRMVKCTMDESNDDGSFYRFHEYHSIISSIFCNHFFCIITRLPITFCNYLRHLRY
uniref:Uncharacterized protein n=1 Tax=Anguilla anguilla TaxID=7936 RepID=A0A0E9R4Z2_ANGAN